MTGFHLKSLLQIVLPVAILVAWYPCTCPAEIVTYLGTTKASWPEASGPVQWVALNGINDVDNGVAEQLDFVGDSLNPGGYWAQDNSYVYFRMRVDKGTAPSGTFSDTVTVLIDLPGDGGVYDSKPNYGFAWDSINVYTNHGLEMQVLASSTGVWSGTAMDDIDGSNGQKGDNDINGSGRTTDGYVRTVDSQATTSFESTTFIDFAVSWDYLTKYTALVPGQTWKVTFGSIANSNDHQSFGADIAGGASLSSNVSDGWSDPIQTQAVPEPSSLAVLTIVAVTGLGVQLRRRRRNRGNDESQRNDSSEPS